MTLTLGECRRLFRTIAGTGNDFTDRLNQVLARLLPEVNAKGTKVRLRFAVYLDSQGNRIITLPPDMETVLAGAYEPCCQGSTGPTGPCFNGQSLPVRNGWYEFSSSGPGNMLGTDAMAGIVMIEGRFRTFADWATPLRMRIKCERDETPGGRFLIRGRLAESEVYSSQSGAWLEGFGLDYTTTAAVTSTQTIDEAPYQIIKPVTRGRVRLYTVDADDVETLVGNYGPNETSPGYTRFKVPACETETTDSNLLPDESPKFLTVCKKAFKPIYDEHDELPITNMGAIRLGLEALLKEDGSDFERATQLWQLAINLLIKEEENLVGAGAQGNIQMDDSFNMEAFPVGI